jgi:hypothetical protein
MDVRVNRSGAKRPDDLGELSRRDALAGRAGHVGSVDDAGDRPLSGRARRLVLPAAEERDDAAGRSPLAAESSDFQARILEIEVALDPSHDLVADAALAAQADDRRPLRLEELAP